MNPPHPSDQAAALAAALAHPGVSTRLQAAMTAGMRPAPDFLEPLVQRCGVEPDFYVRDMLTWALTQLGAEVTVPALLTQAHSPVAQARAQALHTLSKIRDARGWEAITRERLADTDEEVARTAWRAAVTLAPEPERAALAERLVCQLGRGGREVQQSLSRCLLDLADVAQQPLRRASTDSDPQVRGHALATEALIRDPESGFEAAVAQAERLEALRFLQGAG